MEFFKTIISTIEQRDAEFERLVAEADALIAQVPAARVLGIRSLMNEATKMYGPSKNVPVRKGDVIIDTSTGGNRLLIATGEQRDDKPIARAEDGSLVTLEPEFVLMGVAVDNAWIRSAAKGLATKFPSNRILAYGASPSRDPLGEGKCETTSDKSTVHNDAHPWVTFIDAAKKDPTVKEPKKTKKGKK